MAHYVDKVIFLNDIKSYQERKKLNPEEPIPHYSAAALLQIANKLSNRPNFAGYSYRQDMVSDAVYVCLKYFDKFDTTHAKQNPFGYFTKTMWFAFLQRIAKEKRQTKIKGKILASAAFESFALQHMDEDEDFKNSFTTFLQDNNYAVAGIEVGEIIEIDPMLKSNDNAIIEAMIEEGDGEDEDTKNMGFDLE